MKEAISKSADTVIPAITPSIKTAVSELKTDKKSSQYNSKADQLTEAKKLFDNNLISEDEYRAMRKNILGIKDWIVQYQWSFGNYLNNRNNKFQRVIQVNPVNLIGNMPEGDNYEKHWN